MRSCGKFSINCTNFLGENSNLSKRSRAQGKSDAKIVLVVTLFSLTARLRGNKWSDDGRNSKDWMMRLLAIGIG